MSEILILATEAIKFRILCLVKIRINFKENQCAMVIVAEKSKKLRELERFEVTKKGTEKVFEELKLFRLP